MEFRKPQIKIVFDVLSMFWIIVSLSLFLYTSTFVDLEPTTAFKGMIGATMLVVGLFMASVDEFGVGYHFDTNIDPVELIGSLSLILVAFVAILVINQTIPAFSSSVLSAGVFAIILGGVAEEVLFRGYILNMISNIAGDGLALLISTVLGATFHAGVYGQKDPSIMAIVAVSFAVLGGVWILSEKTFKRHGRPIRGRRLSVVMTAHALVNLVAMIG